MRTSFFTRETIMQGSCCRCGDFTGSQHGEAETGELGMILDIQPVCQDCVDREVHQMAADGRWTDEEICPPGHDCEFRRALGETE